MLNIVHNSVQSLGIARIEARTETHEDHADGGGGRGVNSVLTGRRTQDTHEYEANAVVMGPEITSSSLLKSARAARGRPQFATWGRRRSESIHTIELERSTRTGPQKCVPISDQ